MTASMVDDSLQILGRCPTCGHELDDFVSLSPEWLEFLCKDRGRDTIETVVACNCERAHADRPEDTLGCGAIAVLTVELAGTGRAVVPTILAARRATVRDRSWDEEATRWDKAMTERVSSVAEKWGATIGGLFGLFGFSLVLSDDRVARVVGSEVTWPWWVLGGLLAATAAASVYGWLRRETGEPVDPLMKGTTFLWLLAAAGVFLYGELKAPLDAGPTFGVITGFAVLFGLSATGFAGLAAQGSPKWVNYLTGNRMRKLRMESADRSARNLRRARIATVVAIGSLGTALVVLWYAPGVRPGVQQVRVERRTGAGDVCGRLLPHSGSGLRIVPDGSREPLSIALADGVLVSAVDSCG